VRIIPRDEAYENLANAIILCAVEDYKQMLTYQKNHRNSQVTEQGIYRLEKFFYSDWFMMLTKLDPSYIIRRIKETINGKSESD
jgi:hypothetical protein